VLFDLVGLADAAGVDLAVAASAAPDKLAANAHRFPVDPCSVNPVRGVAPTRR